FHVFFFSSRGRHTRFSRDCSSDVCSSDLVGLEQRLLAPADPLLAISKERVRRGEQPLFQSHMWDGSAVPLNENLQIAEQLLEECAAARVILEIEVGVVGGEEGGIVGAIDEKLYTTVEDGMATAAALGLGEKGRYIAALTFGNVHGVYKPGNVKLRPE